MMPHHWRPLAHKRNSIFKCQQHTCTLHDPWGPEKYDYTMICLQSHILKPNRRPDNGTIIDAMFLIDKSHNRAIHLYAKRWPSFNVSFQSYSTGKKNHQLLKEKPIGHEIQSIRLYRQEFQSIRLCIIPDI